MTRVRETGGSTNVAMIGAALLKRRMLIISGIMLFFSLCILTCTVKWQTSDRYKVLNFIDAKWTASYDVPARRGSIRARGGSILAISEETYSVIIDPTHIENTASIAGNLSGKLKKPPEEITAAIEQCRAEKKRYLPLASGLSHAEMVDVQGLNLKGVFIINDYRRFYPFKDQLSPHTVGFIRNRDGVHYQSEVAFNEILEGDSGKVYYQRDSKWGRIPDSTFVLKEVHNGRDVYLTIDENIQIVAEVELDTAIEENRADWGLVAVMDPYTGEILADAVRPTFDPNECVKGGTVESIASNPLYSYIVEPGSVFKPIFVAGALERGYVSLAKHYYCPPSIKIGDTVISEAHKGIGYGDITVAQGVVVSSNVLMGQLARDLGMNRIMDIVNGDMLTKSSGLGFPTEASGKQPDNAILDKRGKYKEQYDGSEARVGFGQAVSMTPLSLLTAYAEIANGGYPVQPKILLGTAKDVSGLVGPADSGTSNYIPYTPVKSKRLLRERPYSSETVAAITQVLVNVVESDRGTGKAARLESGLPVAGKTGTAQIPNPHGRGYLKGQYLASFMGFFPANAPRYVVLVMFKNPRGKYYGGQVAAPVFKRVADRICYLDRITPEIAGMMQSSGDNDY